MEDGGEHLSGDEVDAWMSFVQVFGTPRTAIQEKLTAM